MFQMFKLLEYLLTDSIYAYLNKNIRNDAKLYSLKFTDTLKFINLKLKKIKFTNTFMM